MPQNMFREVRRIKDFARKNGFKHLKDFPYAFAYGYRYSKDDPKIFSANWYNLPDIHVVIDQLTKDWQADNLPLTIELENEKVKITHTQLPTPHLTLPARLTLSPEISYLLGFSRIPDKTILTFSDGLVQYASHPPHCFADLIEEQLKNLLKQLDLEAPTNIVYKMHDVYEKMIALMEEKLQEKDAQCAESKKKLIEETNDPCKSTQELREQHHHELNELYVQSEDTINNLRRYYEQQMQNITSELHSQLKTQSKQFQDEMEWTTSTHEKEVDEMKQKHQMEMDQMEETHDDLQKESLDYKEKLESMEKQHLKEMESLTAKHKNSLQELADNVKNQNSLGMFIQDPMIVDCRDRADKHITAIANFDEGVMSSRKWSLKGTITGTELRDVGDMETLYVVQMQDYSGTIDISGFGGHGDVMQKFLVVGKQYYLEMIEDMSKKDISIDEIQVDEPSPNDLRVTIKNTDFHVKFLEVSE